MKFKVLERHDPAGRAKGCSETQKDWADYVCIDEKGVIHRIDLAVDGLDLPDMRQVINKTIEIDYLHPHLEIAHNVKILDEE